jgi:hypothetical protein
LAQLLECFQDAERLIAQFLQYNWFMKALKSGTNEEQFIEINDRMMHISQDLQLGISIQQVFDRQQDKADEGTIICVPLPLWRL